MSVYNKYTVYIILLVTIILIFTGCKNDDNREIVNTKLTCLNSIEIGLEADVLFINDEYVLYKESNSKEINISVDKLFMKNMDTCTVVEISLGDEYEILDAIIYNGKIYASVYNGTVAKIIEFSMSGNNKIIETFSSTFLYNYNTAPYFQKEGNILIYSFYSSNEKGVSVGGIKKLNLDTLEITIVNQFEEKSGFSFLTNRICVSEGNVFHFVKKNSQAILEGFSLTGEVYYSLKLPENYKMYEYDFINEKMVLSLSVNEETANWTNEICIIDLKTNDFMKKDISILNNGERVENEFPIFSVYALKDDFIIGIDENFNIVKFEIQNILKTNKIFAQHEGINNVIKLQNGVGIYNLKDGYLYIYTIN